MLIIAFAALSLLNFASSFPTGAPDFICDKGSPFIPEHGEGIFPQAISKNPFIIVANATSFAPNQGPISVTIRGKSGEQFKGFFLQAVDSNTTEPIGNFRETKQTKRIIKCSAITQSDASLKPKMTLLWDPAEGQSGNVAFRGVVVKSKETFWVNLNSVIQ